MSQLKLYVSGPITGLPDGNRPAFEGAKAFLISQGYEAITPFDGESLEDTAETLKDKYGKMYWKVLAKDVITLSEVDGVVFLQGWDVSKGARIEALIALFSGKKFFGYWPTSINKLYPLEAAEVVDELRESLA